MVAREDSWQDELERLVSRNFSATRISFSYVEKKAAVAYLSIYGLLATIEECIYGASDHQVAVAKLSWWLQEFRLARSGRGNHPFSCLLSSSGMLSAWPEQLLVKLISLAVQRVNAQGLNTESELRSLCESIGMIHLDLESSVSGAKATDSPLIRSWAAVNGQMQLLRETFWSPQSDYYWLPLTVCAQLSLERRNIAEAMESGLDHNLIGTIFSSICTTGIVPSLFESKSGEVPEHWARANRHWLVFSLLQQRQLRRLSQLRFGPGLAKLHIRRQLGQLKFTDGWAAWRLARQLI